MSSLRECARSIREEAADGIAWIAVWKVGRSWNAEAFWPEDFYYGSAVLEVSPDDLKRLRKIVGADPAAVLVNGYYSNIGCYEDGTLPDLEALADGLRWQYENCHPLVADWTLKEVS